MCVCKSLSMIDTSLLLSIHYEYLSQDTVVGGAGLRLSGARLCASSSAVASCTPRLASSSAVPAVVGAAAVASPGEG